MSWTIKGTGTSGGTCAACKKKNLKVTIVILEDGSTVPWVCGRDCAAKLVYGESNPKNLKRIEAEARQADLAAAQKKQRKRERISIGGIDKTNRLYIQSGRPNTGSYLASKGDAVVRVDGTDPEDVMFYEMMGFLKASATITPRY